MKSLDDIYTAEWFANDFADLQPEFNVVADAIYRQFRPHHATDFGCGPGMVVRRLRELGVEAYGFDGSKHAWQYASDEVKPYIAQADLIEIAPKLGSAPILNRDGRIGLGGMGSVTICTEVAEHIPEEHAGTLVRLLVAGMCPIIFTAAPTGQGGHFHVNCQPQEYWLELFKAHGVICDWSATIELQARWAGLKRLSHMPKNLQVYR